MTTTTTTGTTEAVAPTLLGLLHAVAGPEVDRDDPPEVHALAFTVRATLDGGASPTDLLDAVIAAKTPPPPTPPPPWAPYLGMALDAFAETGVA